VLDSKLGVHTRTAAAAAAFRRPVLARIQQLRELVARGRAELNAKRAREEAQERPA
jgi:hypothetical protein